MDSGLPPLGIDLAEDGGPRILSSMIALIVLPTMFVVARLVSRSIARAGFWVRAPQTQAIQTVLTSVGIGR